mmetsp:Transcript_21317/g.48710  ORF Transcript_21317/g.48710 Transcript_21317/m.48710 type:complete len:231 (-) Transcript_21317:341-1033(-)
MGGPGRLHRRARAQRLHRLHHREPACNTGGHGGGVGRAHVLHDQGREGREGQGPRRQGDADHLRESASSPRRRAHGHERHRDKGPGHLHARRPREVLRQERLRHRPDGVQGRRAQLRLGQGGCHEEEASARRRGYPPVRWPRLLHRGHTQGAAAVQGVHQLASRATPWQRHHPRCLASRGRDGDAHPGQLQGLGDRQPRQRAAPHGAGDAGVHVHGAGRAGRGEAHHLQP